MLPRRCVREPPIGERCCGGRLWKPSPPQASSLLLSPAGIGYEATRAPKRRRSRGRTSKWKRRRIARTPRTRKPRRGGEGQRRRRARVGRVRARPSAGAVGLPGAGGRRALGGGEDPAQHRRDRVPVLEGRVFRAGGDRGLILRSTTAVITWMSCFSFTACVWAEHGQRKIDLFWPVLCVFVRPPRSAGGVFFLTMSLFFNYCCLVVVACPIHTDVAAGGGK